MSSFSFKKEAKVYVVFAEEMFNIDISAIDFSQTIEELSYSNKTLQVKNMFEQSLINKANPANFELTFPNIREADLQTLFNRVLDYNSFDLYVTTNSNIFKVSNCVVTKAAFLIQKNRPLSLSIGGEGIKVSLVTALPHVVQPRSATRTYNRIQFLNVVFGSSGLKDSVVTIDINLETDIQWIPYTGAADAIKALRDDSLMFPREFVVKKRNLFGNLSVHDLIDTPFQVDDTLLIEVGERLGGTLFGFRFDMKNVSHTNRINTGEIFSQQYSWRMTQNPDFLSEVISYIGFINLNKTIQDYLNNDILDSSSLPILESP